MEFESDDDMAEQSKNGNDAKAEGKVRVKKKQYTIMNLVAKKRKERKPKIATRIQAKMMKMIRLLSQMKWHFPVLEMTFS